MDLDKWPPATTKQHSLPTMCSSGVLDWLDRVSKLAGSAPIKIALMLLRQASELGRTNDLAVTKQQTGRLGLSRSAIFKGLETLHDYALLDISRRRGQEPEVDLLID